MVKRSRSAKNDLARLVIIQFAVYAALCVMAFIAWVMAFTQNTLVLEALVGEYIRGHFVRWTAQFPLWGIFILISGALSLGAVRLLWNSRKEGVYLCIVSFSIGFTTNIVLARNILVHILVGVFIGWTLLALLVLLWKNLK